MIAAVLLAEGAGAASLSFDIVPQIVQEGDVFVAGLKLESPAEKINVLDGAILFNKDILQVEDVSTGNSIFSLWTRTPVFSNQSGKIMFTGGVPGGFKSSAGNVLKVVFSAKKEGATTLGFSSDTYLFLNDGKGTKISPQFKATTIVVKKYQTGVSGQNEWRESVSKDKKAPIGLKVALGKDINVFDNKYFISFSAQDAETGINYYEVKEGGGGFIRSESPHVLKDQSLKNKIIIKAVDKAGNETLTTFDPQRKPFNYRLVLSIILVIILLLIAAKLIGKRYAGGKASAS